MCCAVERASLQDWVYKRQSALKVTGYWKKKPTELETCVASADVIDDDCKNQTLSFEHVRIWHLPLSEHLIRSKLPKQSLPSVQDKCTKVLKWHKDEFPYNCVTQRAPRDCVERKNTAKLHRKLGLWPQCSPKSVFKCTRLSGDGFRVRLRGEKERERESTRETWEETGTDWGREGRRKKRLNEEIRRILTERESRTVR